MSALRSNFSPPLVPEDEWKKVTSDLVASYPYEPAFGAPFNTGNDTFGLSPGYKIMSAISRLLLHCAYVSIAHLYSRRPLVYWPTAILG